SAPLTPSLHDALPIYIGLQALAGEARAIDFDSDGRGIAGPRGGTALDGGMIGCDLINDDRLVAIITEQDDSRGQRLARGGAAGADRKRTRPNSHPPPT